MKIVKVSLLVLILFHISLKSATSSCSSRQSGQAENSESISWKVGAKTGSSSHPSTSEPSSSSSSSTRPTRYSPSPFEKKIEAALPSFTEREKHSGITKLISEYYGFDTINVADAVQQWRNRIPTDAQLPPHDDHFPIAGLEPYWFNIHEGGQFVGQLSLGGGYEFIKEYFEPNNSNKPRFAGFKVYLFNTKYANAYLPDANKQCYLQFILDPSSKTPRLTNDLRPFGGNRFHTFEYEGDTTRQIPAKAPSIVVPQADGSRLHVWVADHDPVKGGSTLGWFLEGPPDPVPAWNVETLKARTIMTTP